MASIPETRASQRTGSKEIVATSFPVSGTVVLDNTPPTITETVTPSPNAAGWNNSNVTVSFDCSDSTTTIVSCSDPAIINTEGKNQAVTGTAEDEAGNTATTTATASLDKTVPGVNIASPTNGAILNVSEVTVGGTVTDTLSGVSGVTCNGIAASVSGSSFTCNVILTEGTNTLVVNATDRAGNVSNSSIDVTVDTIPPTVAITDPIDGTTVNSSPVTVTGTVDDETATVLVNGVGATVSNGKFTVNVPLLEGPNTVTVTGTDAAGNVGAASIQIILQTDTDPPDLMIVTPAEGGFIIQNQPPIDINYSDESGIDRTSFTLTVNGTALPVNCDLGPTSGRCTLTTNLPEGSNTLVVSISDLIGNTATKEATFTVDSVPVEINIAGPVDGLITKDGEIQVTGTVGPNVATLTVNGVEATFGSPFTAIVPLREGTNMIVAVATKANGKTGTDSVDVTRDIVAPIVRIDSPREGFLSVNNTVAVTGLVNDIVNGATNAVVKVKGVEAVVADGSFMVMDIPLVRGPNTIEAVATDSVGNVGRHSINVTFQPPVGARMTIASGNGQFESVLQPLPEPLVIVVKDDLGNPVAGRVIQFEVTRNSGFLTKNEGEEPKRIVQVPTDGSGQASVLFTLGDTSGEGNNRVRATALGVAGEVEFCASGLATSPARILMSMGDNQRGIVGNPLAIPLEALVVDKDGNPSKDIPVTFAVVTGNGNLNAEQSLERFTGTDGVARAVYTLGPEPGINNNVVNAIFPGLTGLPATFISSGLTPGNSEETTFSGVVLDSGHTPIPGAIVTIPDTGVNGITDDEGQFLLVNVPVGHIHLRIDPTASPRPETFPSLEFETVTVSGQRNVLGQPIIIPALDTEGSKIVGGLEDVALSMKGVPGLELTVFANSVTCPPGAPDRSPDSTQCRVTISQVHLDKVPMPPPNGTSFMPPAWTVQPPGVQFDPPARISIPNNGLPPGRIIDIFQFDHTLNEFINIGKGTVSENGFVVVSDPGFGITRAGWGGGAPPPPPPTCTCGCDDNNACTTDSCSGQPNCACSNEPAEDETSCDDGKFCTDKDKCVSGQCQGESKLNKTLPTGTFALNLDKLFDSVKGFLKTLFGDEAPDIKLQVSGSVGKVDTCCDEKMQFVLEKKFTRGASAGISTGDLPIPGLAVKLPFSLGEAGIFVNFGLSGSGTLTGQEDNCLDSIKGQLSGQISGLGSLKGKLETPGEVVDIVASGTTGLSGSIVGSMTKAEINTNFSGGHKGLIGTVSVTFFNGLIKEAINFTFIQPDSLAPVSVTIPFTA